jgi:hypothetical protein
MKAFLSMAELSRLLSRGPQWWHDSGRPLKLIIPLLQLFSDVYVTYLSLLPRVAASALNNFILHLRKLVVVLLLQLF